MLKALLSANKFDLASKLRSLLGLQHQKASIILFTISKAAISTVLIARIKQIGSVTKA